MHELISHSRVYCICLSGVQFILVISKRGETRNIGLANKRHADAPLRTAFDEDSKSIIGQDAQQLISECGCVVRRMARFNVTNFKSQDKQLKEDMISNVSVLYFCSFVEVGYIMFSSFILMR